MQSTVEKSARLSFLGSAAPLAQVDSGSIRGLKWTKLTRYLLSTVCKKPGEHTGAGFGLAELLHGRVATVCTTREALEGFIGDSITVVLPLQMPDLENQEYVCTFLLETAYT